MSVIRIDLPETWGGPLDAAIDDHVALQVLDSAASSMPLWISLGLGAVYRGCLAEEQERLRLAIREIDRRTEAFPRLIATLRSRVDALDVEIARLDAVLYGPLDEAISATRPQR